MAHGPVPRLRLRGWPFFIPKRNATISQEILTSRGRGGKKEVAEIWHPLQGVIVVAPSGTQGCFPLVTPGSWGVAKKGKEDINEKVQDNEQGN